MSRLIVFFSEFFLQTRHRYIFLEWLLFLSLFFIGDFVLSFYLLKIMDFFHFILIVLFVHFLYFIWFSLLLIQDGIRMKELLHTGQFQEKYFKIFLSRFIPMMFLLSPGLVGVGLGFLLVFPFGYPLGSFMTKRAKIDWFQVYEVLSLEQDFF